MAKNKTLRGNGADLTKASLDGPARTPFRLQDFQSRSWKGAERPAGPPVAHCARALDLPATPVPRMARRCAAHWARRLACEAQLRGAAPFRRGFGLPPTSRAPAAERRGVPGRGSAALSARRSGAAHAREIRCVMSRVRASVRRAVRGEAPDVR